MAIFGALSAARSGLINSSAALGVIGNNVANVNTIAFKSSRVEFTDLLSAEGGGDLGRVGLGSRIGTVRTIVGQGPIESTGRSLDLAIEGDGYFIVRESDGLLFTRAGTFNLDSNGTVVSTAGLPLQGRALTSDQEPVGPLIDLSVAGIASQAQATANVTVDANLDSGVSLVGPFDATSFDTAYNTSNFSSAITIFDSLGAPHNVSVFFTKTGTNAWDFNFVVDAGETGGSIGTPQVIGNGSLTFNTDGSLDTVTGNTATVTFTGATAQTITFDFGTPNPGLATPGEGLDGLTQFASPSALALQFQDGFPAGSLLGLGVTDEGLVEGSFDNGQTRPLFRLALARFTNPEGLIPLGNGLFRESVDSGTPVPGSPQTGGLGSIVGGALEQSNVQIAQQFIDLISAQRAFQANARLITASDTLLADLINIVR